jgi:hypothetical protein
MRHLKILAVAACVAAAGCGSDSSSPSTPSQPNTINFTATLTPANEVPAITNAESTGRGTATIKFNVTRDSAGAIQSGNILFHYDLTGFPAGTTINLSHIHTGGPTVAGPILVNTGQTAATALGLPTGAGSYEVTATTDAATMQSIIDNPANFYFNVHSSLNPGGVARGQLVKQ